MALDLGVFEEAVEVDEPRAEGRLVLPAWTSAVAVICTPWTASGPPAPSCSASAGLSRSLSPVVTSVSEQALVLKLPWLS